MKDMEHEFVANKALIERDFHTTLIDLTDALFERGR